MRHSTGSRKTEVSVFNITKGCALAGRCRIASTFRERTVGLLNRATLAEGEGLLIERCNAIHMVGMRFAIDVVFFDREMCVLKAVSGVKPWIGIVAQPGAFGVLELPVGTVAATRTEKGDVLEARATD